MPRATSYLMKFSQPLVHVVASGLALQYAWYVSQSPYVKTGLQFIAPLLIIMAVHLGWLLVTRGAVRGFSQLVYWRSTQSAVGMAAVILMASIFAPQPANAGVDDVMETVFVVVFCVAIIALVVGVISLFVYLIFKGISKLGSAMGTIDDDDPKSRFFDMGSLALTAGFLALCSVEGVPNAYSFGVANRSVATHMVQASPEQVWATLETATSPDFALPNVLSVFPQPVDVVVDEGIDLGAQRKVAFQGREGAGHLTLQVVERTQNRVVFDVKSDTTPFANWLSYQRLSYEVQVTPAGTQLSVALEYDRLLAPSWFFTPATKGAAYLAMDVLARDVKARAEG